MRRLMLSAVAAAALLSTPAARGQEGAPGWSALEDPQLGGLIDRALAANTDLREAAARVEAARAAASVARRNRLPDGGIAVSATRFSPAAAETGGGARAGTAELAAAGADAAWEVDLFGRLRAAERAALERAAGAQSDAEALRISVTAEVARSYFLLRAARERHAIRERYRAHQAEIVAMSEALAAEGRLPPGELARARAELASDLAEAEAAAEEAARLESALAVLLGEVPGRWHLPAQQDLTPLRLRPVELPAAQDLLLQRPDVRAAEQRLRAEHADVGAAAAARYPRLSLSGVFGFIAGGFADLGASETESWSGAGVLRWNIFGLPRLAAQLGVEEAEAEAALAALDRAVLRAFEDVENALRGYHSAQRQAEARVNQASQARIAANAAQARYEEGATTYLDALDARRDALRADVAAADAVARQRTAVIELLRALAVPVAGPA